MPPIPTRLLPGRPYPLGATWDGLGVNFALFSAHADASSCACSTRPAGARSSASRCRNTPTRSGTATCRKRGPGQLYGYRVHGPYEPRARPPLQSATSCCSTPMPRQLVGAAALARCAVRLPRRRGRATTCRSTGATAPPACRRPRGRHGFHLGRRPARRACPGTTPSSTRRMCAASPCCIRRCRPARARHLRRARPTRAVIDYLQQLGVTAVELLPIHAFLDDRHLVERGLRNYWGYNTIGFFAPEPRYLVEPGSRPSSRMAVRRLHDAGIEVILDVVYNHTGEGNELGPTLSFRGIDNAILLPAGAGRPALLHQRHRHRQHPELCHPRVLQMVMDSLRYWVRRCTSTASASISAPSSAREAARLRPGSGFLDACGRTRCCRGSS